MLPIVYIEYFSLPTLAGQIKYSARMFGEELRKLRQAAEMTQEKLSFEANLHRTYISQLERNKKSPTLEVLLRICEALGVSAAKLVARVERERGKTRQPK